MASLTLSTMREAQERCVEPGMAWSRSPLHEHPAERQEAPHTALLIRRNNPARIGDRQTLNPFPSASRSPEAERTPASDPPKLFTGPLPPELSYRAKTGTSYIDTHNIYMTHTYMQ